MGISETVDAKWKQLMDHAEKRRAVVFSSYNFYRAAEQVILLSCYHNVFASLIILLSQFDRN